MLKPTASEQHCRSLCTSSNRVFFFNSHLTFVFAYPGCFLLPRGDLSEPKTRHNHRSLRIWYCSVTTIFSSVLTALRLCLLSYSSSFMLWPLLACCGLKFYFSINFKRALLFILIPRPAQNHPILPFFAHCSCSESDKLSYTSTVGPSSPLQNLRSPRTADSKKGRADMVRVIWMWSWCSKPAASAQSVRIKRQVSRKQTPSASNLFFHTVTNSLNVPNIKTWMDRRVWLRAINFETWHNHVAAQLWSK